MKKNYCAGDIVLVPFPFSDLSKNKVRPAVVLAEDKEDYTLVFITSTKPKGLLYVELSANEKNHLKVVSYVRYTKIASLDRSIVLGKIGELSEKDLQQIRKRIVEYLTS